MADVGETSGWFQWVGPLLATVGLGVGTWAKMDRAAVEAKIEAIRKERNDDSQRIWDKLILTTGGLADDRLEDSRRFATREDMLQSEARRRTDMQDLEGRLSKQIDGIHASLAEIVKHLPPVKYRGRE